jgi:hypothetical protein
MVKALDCQAAVPSVGVPVGFLKRIVGIGGGIINRVSFYLRIGCGNGTVFHSTSPAVICDCRVPNPSTSKLPSCRKTDHNAITLLQSVPVGQYEY